MIQLSSQHKVHPISAFADNYIWVIINQTNNYVSVIDPGDASPVINFLEENNLILEAILLTHHHTDHIGGVQKLMEKYHPTIFAPKSKKIPYTQQPLTDGNALMLDKTNFALSTITVPGHTLDHIAYYATAHCALFCGDTLFSAGCGRIFEGTPKQMLHSLQKILQLPDETLIFCAHEYTLANLVFAQAVESENEHIKKHLKNVKSLRSIEQASLPSTLSLEKKINPFLRVDQPTVKMSAEKYMGHALHSDVEVFAAIREWKNRF